jgi:predicted metalloprotease with PDZ domain
MTRAAAHLIFSAVILISAGSIHAATLRISLEVDARDITHGIQHAHLTFPVHAGHLTLAYPKWIPGEHKPSGPITQLMNLHMMAGDRPLVWRRDSLDAFLFHVVVPPHVSALDVRFDYFSPPKSFGSGYGETPSATPHLLVLAFNQLILYPAESSAEAIEVKAQVLIPRGWRFDGALPPEQSEGGVISLPIVSLSKLIDSPLLVGEYFRSIPLTEGTGSTRLSIAADAPGDLAVSDTLVAGLRKVVAEGTALFGPGHYGQYVWLLALSNRLSHDGLEHHESSDIREVEALLTDPAYRIDWRLFPHEYVHSWNGKYRLPQGLATRSYQQPMIDDLLWFYEGLTRFYGDLVLSARSGLVTLEQTRAYLAYVGALMDRDRPGREWRSVADTATAVPAYGDAPSEWATIRRGSDYYNEMLLVWLEADTLIRRNTSGKRSLDDFCQSFFGGAERSPTMRPYSRSDVVEALRGVAALNWDAFFSSRIDSIDPRAPLDGILASGWTLSYDDTPNAFLEALEKTSNSDNLSLSLGIWTKPDGTVVDAVTGSPAYAEGLAPAMQVIAINGHRWTIGAARDAIVQAEKISDPLELIVASGDLVRTVRLKYHDGLRNPHLKRNSSEPDLLSDILAPRTGGAP